MHIYITLACAAAAAALFALFRIRMDDFKSFLSLFHRKASFKQLAGRKENRLVRGIRNTKAMMEATGQAGRFYALLVFSLLLLAVGFSVGTSLDNIYLAPVLAVGFAALPFIYIRFQFIKYNKLVVEELETALSVISISYERTENILLSFEENLQNINPPIRQVFQEFVNTVTFVDPSLENAIDDMKRKINHSVFYEWCDALKRCVQNRSLKHTLRPIVNKLTEIKVVTNELHNILYKTVLYFWILLALTVTTLFVGLKIIPGSLQLTVPATLTHILVAVNVLLIVAAAIRVAIETHEIKFDI